MIEKKTPIILTSISVFISWRSCGLGRAFWQHLSIVILGKHQIRVYWTLTNINTGPNSHEHQTLILSFSQVTCFGLPHILCLAGRLWKFMRNNFAETRGSISQFTWGPNTLEFAGIYITTFRQYSQSTGPELAPFLCVREQCWLFWIIWINTGKFILCLICICQDMLCILHREIDCTKK